MTDWNMNFDFVLPTKIIFGAGVAKQAALQLAALGLHRPLVVTDPGVRKVGVVETVCAPLEEAGVSYQIFDGVEANPKDVNAEAGAAAYRAFGADCLIAIGGGSPIDCAKAIGVLIAHNADQIKPYEGKTAATKPNPPLICVPTTAGTGSEVTFSSVITDTKNRYKMTVKSPYTAPNVALCDPLLTLSVPRNVTAATGVDALTHAIEGFTANCAEPIGDAVALYSIELIYENLPAAVRDGSDFSARSAMLMGSLLGAMSFSHSDVASVHCIAEALGSMYDLPHGTCNAIFLPYVMEYNMPYCMPRYARIARAMGAVFESEEEGAKEAVCRVKQLTKEVGLPAFASLHVDEQDFDAIAQMSVNNGSNGSNPRPMEKEDYLNILRAAYAAGE